MAGRIRNEDVQALRERADIVEVVSSYTALKRAGARMKGLCPFHQENTPSFTVDPGQNLYHCFGCQAGGDVITFLREIEGFDFPEAVEHLARRMGFTLHYEELSSGQRRSLGERTQLQELNAAALAFYRDVLLGPDGEVARDYLKERGFGREDAERFELGFAPNEWDRLSRHLITQGADQRDITRVGLAITSDRGGLRDRFKGRLLFPIKDAGGDVIGFGGRILPGIEYGDFEPPKYLNTAETPLYHKSKVLYGLPQARSTMARTGQVLICEGYTDVMALHQAGITNAVATCGTAVGEDHVRVLTRYVHQLVLAFDGDAAGAGAAERAWRIAKAFDVDVRVLLLPVGQDPADVVRSDEGADGLRTRVAHAEPVVPFAIRRTVDAHDLATQEGRTSALQAAVGLLGDVADPDLRRQYARTEIADRVGVSIEFVQRTAARAGVSLDQHEGIAAVAAGRPKTTSRGPLGRLASGRVRLERAALRIALQHAELLPDAWYELEDGDFTHPTARGVFGAIMAAGGPGVTLASVLDGATDDDLRDVIRGVALEEDPLAADAEHAVATIQRLLLPRVESEIARRKAAIAQRNAGTDAHGFEAAFREILVLEERARALRATTD